MSTSADETKKITSDALHNQNCFSYLKNLKLTKEIYAILETVSPEIVAGLKKAQEKDYDSNYPYADIYTKFFTEVEGNIETIFNNPRTQFQTQVALSENLGKISKTDPYYQVTALLIRSQQEHASLSSQALNGLDDFIFSIYDNDNDILKQTFTFIKTIPLKHTPVASGIEGTISSALKDTGKKINQNTQSPADVGSLFGRITSTISNDFKPQHTTSLATVRKYNHIQNNPNEPREYRFGTQAQRDKGEARVSPLFEQWLEVHNRKHNPDNIPDKITHVYFNNLAFTRDDTEGKIERALTNELHNLENRHSNVVVITLPADQGLMDKDEYKKTDDKLNFDDVYDEFLKIANQDETATTKIKDFYISERTRKLVFKDENGHYSDEIERKQLKALLDKSFTALGITDKSTLSSAQKQAVWFHFIKFELTNHILQKLKPASKNFACKDAIDRAGAASAYYNLLKSFEDTPGNTAMSRDNFEEAIHAAPAMVKARGMNHHLRILWNAVDAYVSSHYNDLNNSKEKSWLIEWRDLNCPHARVKKLLTTRVEQNLKELTDIVNKSDDARHNYDALNRGIEILKMIKLQTGLGVSGERLLLEATARTRDILLNPNQTPDNLKTYAALADKLTIRFPRLQMLGGIMKSLVGVLLYVPSLGYSKNLINSGMATFKAGHDSERRKEIQGKMKQQIKKLQGNENPSDNSTDSQAPH